VLFISFCSIFSCISISNFLSPFSSNFFCSFLYGTLKCQFLISCCIVLFDVFYYFSLLNAFMFLYFVIYRLQQIAYVCYLHYEKLYTIKYTIQRLYPNGNIVLNSYQVMHARKLQFLNQSGGRRGLLLKWIFNPRVVTWGLTFPEVNIYVDY
jgi:hypothetical protein